MTTTANKMVRGSTKLNGKDDPELLRSGSDIEESDSVSEHKGTW